MACYQAEEGVDSRIHPRGSDLHHRRECPSLHHPLLSPLIVLGDQGPDSDIVLVVPACGCLVIDDRICLVRKNARLSSGSARR
jgi:hypothetical protein